MSNRSGAGVFGVRIAAVVLALAAAAAWSNALSVPFLLDDGPAIVLNPSIKRLARIGEVLWPSIEGGVTTAGRPLVNLSLAVNHAIGGTGVAGYHVFNLAVHIAAGLVLFGLVRRTVALKAIEGLPLAGARSHEGGDLGTGVPLASARSHTAGGGGSRFPQRDEIRETGPSPRGRSEPQGQGSGDGRSPRARSEPRPGIPSRTAGGPGEAAWAAGIAALWMLHPLQTAAVTYIVQRAEAMAGLFVLLTLYSFARAANGGGSRWLGISVAAAFAGVATKETAVVAPLLVWLYDRTFVAGSFGAAWRARRGYYLGLASSWLLLACLVAATGGRGGTAGFGTAVGPGEYFLTQCAAVVHYLRLVVWPSPLVFDYGTATVGIGGAWWQLLLLLCLVGATIVGVKRRSLWGFVGAWFLLALAPSSSVVPVASQTMAEHRMYLALAAPVAAVAVGLRAWLGAKAAWVLAGLAVVAGAATFARNADFASAISIWTDTVAKRPGNARAHHNLALAELARGRPAEAERHLQAALRLAPQSPESLYNLGVVLTRLGRMEEAVARYRESLALDPAQAAAHNNLGNLLFAAGRTGEAGRHYAEALRLQPEFAGARNSYGNWLLAANRPAEALAEFEAAVALEPESAEYRFNAGNACAALGRFDEAAARFRAAARLDPAHAEARNNLGNVLLEMGRLPEALAEFEAALKLQPDYFEPRRTLALLYLLHLNRATEARAHLEILARARPGDREIAEALRRAGGR